MENLFTENKNGVVLNVLVIPRSSKSEVVSAYNNCLKVKLKSPPIDNAANEELIRLLAVALNLTGSLTGSDPVKES